MTDTEAMNAIQRILDATEWDSDTCDRISEIVTSTGRQIRDYEEK